MNTKPKLNQWPAAIIGFFVVFISFTVGIIGYISDQKMDLVRGDYYEDEIRYQKQLDRINRTRELNSQITVGYDRASDLITINLPPAAPARALEGRIQLYRPSDETLDREVALALSPAGRQDVDTKSLRPGLWKVRVYWKMDGQDYYFGQSVVVAPKKS